MVGNGFDHSGTVDVNNGHCGYDCGGTADFDYILHTIGVMTDLDLAERNRYIHECWLFLQEKLGAVLSADKWQILYWVKTKQNFIRPVLARKPLTIHAGYMSEARGRHWKRNSQ